MGTPRRRLSDVEERCLNHCFKDIKRDLIMDDIAGDLIKERVLTIKEWEDLRKHQLESKKTEEFLFMLHRRSSNEYRSFINALREHRYDHLADSLEHKEGFDQEGEEAGGGLKTEASGGIRGNKEQRRAFEEALLNTHYAVPEVPEKHGQPIILSGDVTLLPMSQEAAAEWIGNAVKDQVKEQLKESEKKNKATLELELGKQRELIREEFQLMQTSDLKKEYEKRISDLQKEITFYKAEIQKLIENNNTLVRRSKEADEKKESAERAMQKYKIKLIQKEKELENLQNQLGSSKIRRANQSPVPTATNVNTAANTIRKNIFMWGGNNIEIPRKPLKK